MYIHGGYVLGYQEALFWKSLENFSICHAKRKCRFAGKKNLAPLATFRGRNSLILDALQSRLLYR